MHGNNRSNDDTKAAAQSSYWDGLVSGIGGNSQGEFFDVGDVDWLDRFRLQPAPVAVMARARTAVLGIELAPSGTADGFTTGLQRPPDEESRFGMNRRWLAAAAIIAILAFGVIITYFGGNDGDDPASVPAALPAALSEATPSPPVESVTPFLLMESLALPEGDSTPYAGAVEIAPDGKIWVIDFANNRLVIFSPDGSTIETVGRKGTEPGQFNFGEGSFNGDIAFASDGSFYVADAANYRIQKFAPDRSFTSEWGVLGSQDGQFTSLIGIEVDDDGSVYVLDASRKDVQIFDEDGQFLGKFTPLSMTGEKLDFLVGIDITNDQFLWFANWGDWADSAVVKTTLDGTLLAQIDGSSTPAGRINPFGVAVDSDGRVFVPDESASGNLMQIFDREGKWLASWNGRISADDEMPVRPWGFAISDEERLYLTENIANRHLVHILQPNPEFWNSSQETPAVIPAAQTLATPSPSAELEVPLLLVDTLDLPGGDANPLSGSLDKAPDGKVWVIDFSNHRLVGFSPDGSSVETFGKKGSEPGQFNFGEGSFNGAIAFADDGSFYVADSANFRIQKFTPNGTFLTQWGSMGIEDSQFTALFGIEVDAAGNVYVLDATRRDVQIFDENGMFLRKVAPHSAAGDPLYYLLGMSLSPDQHLWFTNSGHKMVVEMTLDGAFVQQFDENSTPTGLFSPLAVAIDSAGRVFVQEESSSQIQIFDKDGKWLAEWDGSNEKGVKISGIPFAIHISDTGLLYVSENYINEHRIQVFMLNPEFWNE